jgi:hypothetical protein
MSKNNSLPLVSITLSFRSSQPQVVQVSSWSTGDTSLVVKAQEVPFQGLFINLTHEQLNTQLDLGGIAPAVILQFDADQQFTGASLSLGTSSGSFGLVTQSKQLLILPIPDAAYAVRVSGVFALADLSATADTNAWMTDAEALIRSRAKREILTHVIRDAEGAAAMAQAEAEELQSLIQETNARSSSGFIVPTEF